MPVGRLSAGTRLRDTALAAMSCVIVTLLALPAAEHADPTTIVLFFVLDVVLVATFLGRGPGIVASFLAVACFDFFFVPPRFSFTVAHAQSLVVFIVMLAVTLIIGYLTHAYREKAREAESRAGEAALLHRLANAMSGATTIEAIAERVNGICREGLGADATLYLVHGADDDLRALPIAYGVDPGRDLAIRSVWLDGRVVEANRDVQDGADTTLLPLTGTTRRRGVMAVHLARDRALPARTALLEAMAAVVTTAVERVHFVDVAHASTLAMAAERQRSAILASLSHDLRTPLTLLYGLADTLAQSPTVTGDDRSTASVLRDQSGHLHRTVDNLLDLARLRSGPVRLRRDWQSIPELAGAAVRSLQPWLDPARIRFDLPAELPLVEADGALLQRVFCNLIENAAKYSPAGSDILIGADVGENGRVLRVRIEDRGPGFPPAGGEAMFEIFERGSREARVPGMGIGLAVCRAIVEAHGGRIEAADRTEGGARVAFELPVGEAPSAPIETLPS